MSEEITALFTGGAIGFITALIGGVFSYMVYLRKHENSNGPVVYLFVVTGTLVFVGVVALILSILTNTFALALLTGMGVFIGFMIAFGVLLYIMMKKSESSRT